MVIIKYEKEEDVQKITDEQIAKGLHLVAVSNIGEGDFLGFDDRDVVPPTQHIVYSNQEIMDKQDSTQKLVMSVMSGVFDLYMK